jgi:hypothetical protein
LKHEATFFVIYIAEAHPDDGWQTDSNEQEGIRIRQHTTSDERRAAAQSCATKLKLSIPTLLDNMDDAANNAFAAWPERIYIVNKFGIIHYRGGRGPFDFHPTEARTSLVDLLGPKPD